MLLRAIQPESRHEVAFLGQVLVEAVNWRPGRRRLTLEDVLADPHLARYVRGWGRQGDGGVIAEEARGPGRGLLVRLSRPTSRAMGLSTNAPRSSGSRWSPIGGDVVSAGTAWCRAVRRSVRRLRGHQPERRT